MTAEARLDYGGRDNLEAMEHAQNYNAHLFELIRRHVTGSEVMDFGAGTGTFAIPSARLYSRVICVEPDTVLSDQLRSAGLEVVNHLDAVAADSIDSIYSFNVLEHIEDDDGILTELLRKLRSGGKLLLYVPAFDLLFSAMDRKVGHFRRYRRAELERKLRRAGFTVILSRYADSLGFFATLAYKLLGSESGSISAGSVRVYDRLLFPVSRLLDRITGRLIGKNLVVVAQKP